MMSSGSDGCGSAVTDKEAAATKKATEMKVAEEAAAVKVTEEATAVKAVEEALAKTTAEEAATAKVAEEPTAAKTLGGAPGVTLDLKVVGRVRGQPPPHGRVPPCNTPCL
jgi:hypothetical protein